MKWCNGHLIEMHVQYGLCIDEKSFHDALRDCGIPPDEWDSFDCGKSAVTHLYRVKPDPLAFVCMPLYPADKRLQAIGLLVHEAMHILQWNMEEMGEKNPGREFEAYAIQRISQDLIQYYEEYARKARRR